MREHARTQERELRMPFGLAALVLVSLGWVVAVLFGDGLELHRSALAMPFVVLGALCGLVEALRGGRVLWMPVLVSGVLALLYFAARAFSSPVWDLGRHDLHLLALGWLTLATVATCAGDARRAGLLVGGVVGLVFAANLVVGLVQQFVDPEFTLLRLSRRTGEGVSGLFWHWNNLAAFLVLALPLFLGMSFGVRSTVLRILFLGAVGLGIWLAYLSKSRAGFAAVILGLGAVGTVLLLKRSWGWNWPARLATWSGLLLAGCLAVAVLFMVASRLSEQRGHGSDLGEAVGKSSRLDLSWAAFDFWWDAMLFGNGSQSYESMLVERWDKTSLPSWLDNPETVHNEYMQVLTDYGLVGFLLLFVFLAALLSRALRRSERDDRGEPSGGVPPGLRLGAVGAIAGAMVHALVEFQLHLLPILLLASVAAGLLAQDQDRRSAGLPVRAVHGVAVLLAAAFALIAVGRESLAGPARVGWDLKRKAADGAVDDELLADYRRLLERAPHFKVARSYGWLNYELALRAGEPDAELLEEARRALATAHERNERDQLTLINYALVLDQLGRFEEALPIHLQAVKLAGARENKYGAYGGMSMHLSLRGRALYQSRKPEEALGCLLLARAYLRESRARNFHFGGADDYLQRKAFLDSLIKLLQEAGIEPHAPRGVPSPKALL